MPRPHPLLNRRLNSKIWRACAGASVQVPTLHSRVYYFPQGHLQQASSTIPFLSPLLLSTPCIPCCVSDVQLLSDCGTDEVYAKLLLQPINDSNASCHPLYQSGDSVEAPDDDKIVSFAKILTPSDANNGGGFSVPRYCADSIFPPLNFQADPPVQTLSITDVHGVVWEFRHIYRGTPRRHLLTTGWSKFVNHKRLVSGDCVVFMKNSRGEMFVGIRRVMRFQAGYAGDCSRWCSQVGGVRTKVEEDKQEDGHSGLRVKGGFSRDEQEKLSGEAVAKAAELAAQNMPFEVVYYPKPGWSDFVVKEEVVEDALNVMWTPGMRVKMPMETEDSSRVTSFQGTVSAASAPDNGPWRGSPWLMLQVTWDEPEVLPNAKRVSPWQVEHVPSMPPLHSAFPSTKRFKVAQGSVLPTDREGDSLFHITGFNHSTMGHFNQPLLSHETFPAGMQGARHDLFSLSSFSNFLGDNSHLCTGDSFGNNTVPKLKTVSTELNIGSSQSENLSPDSQSSLRSFNTEFVGTSCNSAKMGVSSFQLFGKIIQMKHPIESGVPSVDCTGDDSSKGCLVTEGIDNQPEHSSTYSKLINRLDVQCQRASTFEVLQAGKQTGRMLASLLTLQL